MRTAQVHPGHAAARQLAPAAAPPARPPATSPTTAVTPVKPSPSRARSTADEAFKTRVKTLEEQVIDLKEKIFRTKARLLLLQETVLGGDLSSGARAVLFHKNEMGGSSSWSRWRTRWTARPSSPRSTRTATSTSAQEFEIFNGRIVPGQHQIAVRLVYRGNGYGVFSYLEGYKFKVQLQLHLQRGAGKVTTVQGGGLREGRHHHRPEGQAGGPLRHRGRNREAAPKPPGRHAEHAASETK